MKKYMEKLKYITIITSLISFFWVGLRHDISQLVISNSKSLLKLVNIFSPYLIFLISIVFIILRLRKPSVSYHNILSIKNKGSDVLDKVVMESHNIIELYSSQAHFQIEIDGVFYGPELNSIKKHFKNDGIKVYAVVVEYSKPDKRELMWVQTNEYGLLGSRGHYKVRAYLGGSQEIDKAQDNDVFNIYVYIPSRKIKEFDEYAVYKKKDLPTPVFLSKPISIRTKRIINK